MDWQNLFDRPRSVNGNFNECEDLDRLNLLDFRHFDLVYDQMGFALCLLEA